jgi:hypothetical protein
MWSVLQPGGIITLLTGTRLPITLPAFSLPYGIFEARVSVSGREKTVGTTAAVEVIPAPLELVVIGGNTTAAIDNTDGFVVDASLSYDPDETTDHPLVFSWT